MDREEKGARDGAQRHPKSGRGENLLQQRRFSHEVGGKPGDQNVPLGSEMGGSQSRGHGGSGGLDTRHTPNKIRFAASDGFEFSSAVRLLSVQM